eukprot:scaffold243114_cov13-Tisochrysis_lutea.AAC.1
MGVKGKEIKKRSDTEESAVLLNRSNSTGARDKQVAAYLREAVLEMGMYQVGTAVAQHGLFVRVIPRDMLRPVAVS